MNQQHQTSFTPSLRDLLRRLDGDDPASGRGFPLVRLVGMVRDACRALEHANRRGLLHLHLRPDALLLGDDDRIVLDVCEWKHMGRRLDDEPEPPAVIGFPYYMSPEQITGADRLFGPATDVFGLGGILHVILFATPPNGLKGGHAVEALRAIAERSSEPRRPGPLRAGIRSSGAGRRIDGLVGICLKALAYEPGGRYPTAAALGEALDGWLAHGRSSWWAAIRRRSGGV